MNANELRIGNLVIINNEITTMEIGWFSAKSKEPIPLTEEWLLNFGFNKHETVGIKTYNYIINYFKFNSAVLWVAEYKGIHIENKILYVHQLQNLYFSLTGEELILKQD